MDMDLPQRVTCGSTLRLGLLSGNELLGQLLRHYIDQDISLQLNTYTETSQANDQVSLWLLDVQSFPVQALESVFAKFYGKTPIALVNVCKEQAETLVENYPWINGVFYSNCPREQFLLGASVLCTGGDWLPRGLMEQLLRQLRRLRQPTDIQTRLTIREREILELVRKGLPNADIATHLCLSPHTIKSHIHNVLRKIGASNRAEAAFLASRSHSS